MKHSAIPILIAAALAIPVVSPSQAQKNEKQHPFGFRTIADPADPDPLTQTVAERTATLQKRMKEAKKLLDDGKLEQCLNKFIDPFWLARAAARSDWTIDELFDKQVRGDKERAGGLADAMATSIESNLDKPPKWLLDGRVASFIAGRSDRIGEFWVYFDGSWRISPQT
jgi:hypothetical protein